MSNTKLCKDTMEYKNSFGNVSGYHSCNKPAKYNISYKDTRNGNLCSRDVCGIHFRSAKKTADRLLNKYDYDCKFTFTEITNL